VSAHFEARGEILAQASEITTRARAYIAVNAFFRRAARVLATFAEQTPSNSARGNLSVISGLAVAKRRSL
jgi:hypothetical protein